MRVVEGAQTTRIFLFLGLYFPNNLVVWARSTLLSSLFSGCYCGPHPPTPFHTIHLLIHRVLSFLWCHLCVFVTSISKVWEGLMTSYLRFRGCTMTSVRGSFLGRMLLIMTLSSFAFFICAWRVTYARVGRLPFSAIVKIFDKLKCFVLCVCLSLSLWLLLEISSSSSVLPFSLPLSSSCSHTFWFL